MHDPDLLVGLASPDDAGVYRLSEETAIVQTVDYFAPVVDDPETYGRIAAANALSDVYAMGGRPITALNIFCYPREPDWRGAAGRILAGGAEKVIEAGAVVVGGHLVDDPEPKYGLAVTGIVHPDRIVRKGGARPGDLLYLTKPIGTGIVTTAMKKGKADAAVAEAAIRSMVALNRSAAEGMLAVGVHAASDVTGYALMGTLLEMLLPGGVSAEIDYAAVPLLPGAEELAARRSIATRMTQENRAFVADRLTWEGSPSRAAEKLLFDPQTSGGLLLAVDEGRGGMLEAELKRRGTPAAARIGRIVEGKTPRIRVRIG